MSTEEKLKEDEDDSSHKTPQAITITIMDPSALETTTFRSIVSSSRESHHSREGSGSMVVVGESDDGTITVSQSAKDLLQTVTETHMGTEELPVISNINSAEDTHEQSTIHIVTKTNEGELEKVDEIEEGDGMEEDIAGYHCLICNAELQDELIPIFKTLTTTSHRKVSLYLGGLVGQKLTSRKAHSDIICSKCFGLLNKLDLLEVEIRDTKESIVNKYQETVSMYGGRARRRKPAAAKKSDFVFPKIEPENECEQAVALEMDETFEPQVDDLMEEEHDRKEESDSQDEDWEPEFKRPRMKRDASEPDPRRTPKRRRGRPRKDASKSKRKASIQHPRPFKCAKVGEESDEIPILIKTDGKTEEIKILALRDMEGNQAITISTNTQCPTCDSNFPTVLHLVDHFKLCHANMEFIQCSLCKVNVKSDLAVYFNHYKTCFPHHESEAVDSNKGIRSHHLLSHSEFNFNAFDDYTLSNTHSVTPPPKPIKTYKCTDCSAVYNNASNLANHRKRNHLGQEARRHLCEVCGNKFVAPSELKIHVSTVHHNMKKYVCEYCGLCFKVVSELSYHRRRHTGEKPHVCKVCGRAFIKPNALAKHVRWVHRMEYQGKYKKRLKKGNQTVEKSLCESVDFAEASTSGYSRVPQLSKEQNCLEKNISSIATCQTTNVKVAPAYNLGKSKWLTFP